MQWAALLRAGGAASGQGRCTSVCAVMSGASPQAMGGSVIGGVQVPKAIDDFIDELLGMSGMLESMGQRVGTASDGTIWGALLLQARANCVYAEANL